MFPPAVGSVSLSVSSAHAQESVWCARSVAAAVGRRGVCAVCIIYLSVKLGLIASWTREERLVLTS